MSLNIKNEETVRLVRDLADELGISLTAAISDAVRARLAEVRGGRADPSRGGEAILGAWAELGERLGREYLARDFDDLLYDEMGVPR